MSKINVPDLSLHVCGRPVPLSVVHRYLETRVAYLDDKSDTKADRGRACSEYIEATEALDAVLNVEVSGG